MAQELHKHYKLYCGLAPVDFTHILQVYFNGIGAIIGMCKCQENNIEDISKNVQYQFITRQEFSV